MYLTSSGNCVSICPDLTYKFSLNHTCVELCPDNYIINEEGDECIFNDISLIHNSEKTEIISSLVNLAIKDLTNKEYITSTPLNGITQLTSSYVNPTKNNFELILDFISSKENSSVIIRSDITQVITTSDKMSIKDQIEKGISAIDLGNCTEVLKEHYNISKEENLIILNQETKNINISENNKDNSINLGKTTLIEIYDLSGRKLDISLCKGGIKVLKYIGDVEQININSAKNFADSGIDIFDPNSEFFNNLCYQYDSQNQKDITIDDRRTDIYQNVSFCQEGCTYEGLDYELMIANCNCDPSSLQDGINNNTENNNNEEVSQFKEIVKSFIANWLDFNFDVIKCYNLTFNKIIIKNNIGFYCMLFMFCCQIFFLIIFLIKKLKPIKDYMINYKTLEIKFSQSNPPKKVIIIKKPKNKDKNKKVNNYLNKNYFGEAIKQMLNKDFKNKIKLNDDNIQSFSQLGINSRIVINVEKNKNNKNNLKLNNKNRTVYKHRIIKSNSLFPNNGCLSLKEKISEREKINKNKENLLIKDKNIIPNNIIYEEIPTQNKNKSNINNYNCFYNEIILKIKLTQHDEDLQDMDFEDAIIKENRSFLRIYWSFLVDAQIILGTFFTENYLDLFVIKLSFLVCTFQISFFLNALFYTDEYISDAYHNEGILDFITGLPKSIYSSVATLITTNLLKMLSNSKSELLTLIRNKEKEIKYIELINVKLKKLRNKLITYFIIIFSLDLFFFYYVASFCAVYRNSQKYWFIGCLESFAMDFTVAIIVCVIMACLRYLSILKKIKCVYTLANIII